LQKANVTKLLTEKIPTRTVFTAPVNFDTRFHECVHRPLFCRCLARDMRLVMLCTWGLVPIVWNSRFCCI